MYKRQVEKGGAYIIDDPEVRAKLSAYVFPDGKNINRDVVGKTPQVVGKAIGIEVPEDRQVLLTKVVGQAQDDVLCKECLFPLKMCIRDSSMVQWSGATIWIRSSGAPSFANAARIMLTAF